jgi:hypothetical protein
MSDKNKTILPPARIWQACLREATRSWPNEVIEQVLVAMSPAGALLEDVPGLARTLPCRWIGT